jgi:indole-3-glycerol phosphate synthase
MEALKTGAALEERVRGLIDADGTAVTRLRARRFADALASGPGASVAVIAEIKRSSPSKGSLNPAIDAAGRAAAYEAGGASAISVLTEPARFGGSLEDLRDVAARVGVPALRKDFVTHRVQLLEARLMGASGVLLIARAMPAEALRELAEQAASMGLGVLAEVRSEEELAVAVRLAGAVIGVNNRDLETLAIEPEVGARLLPLVPRDRVAVYESGVSSRGDVERAALLGADAVLVGSILSRAADAPASVRGLTGVPRCSRG